MRDLAQRPVELLEAAADVVEAPGGELPLALEHVRVELLLQVLHLRRERQHVLDRPVVKIERQPYQLALGGRDERLLAGPAAVEQQLALEDEPERLRRLRQKGRGTVAARRDGVPDERAHDLVEAHDRRRGGERAPEHMQAGAAAEHGARLGPRAAARLALAEVEDALRLAGDGPAPERDGLKQSEVEEQPQLDAGRDEWRQLEQSRVRDGTGEDEEARSLQVDAEGLGERRDGGLDVLGGELAFRRQRDDGVGGIGDGAGLLCCRPASCRGYDLLGARVRLGDELGHVERSGWDEGVPDAVERAARSGGRRHRLLGRRCLRLTCGRLRRRHGRLESLIS